MQALRSNLNTLRCGNLLSMKTKIMFLRGKYHDYKLASATSSRDLHRHLDQAIDDLTKKTEAKI